MATDIIARGMIAEHTDNSDIHVTVSDKENWNSHPNDVQASGNSVQIDGLQGGVPFSAIMVSGKNLTGNTIISTTGKPVIVTNTDSWSIEWTTGFGIRLSDVKVEMNKDYTVKYSQKSENGTDSMRIMIINSDTGNTVSEQNTANVLTGDEYTDNTFTFNSGTANHIYIRFVRATSTGKATLSKMKQLELGDTATAYEPPITGRELTVNVNGSDYTITPDSNPYVIPNDIRQLDGLNTISVSAGTLSVTGVRKNAAIKRIWDEIDEIKTAIIVSNGESE